jgi:iron-sulfur cluster repair protein YtfE (RIC family)
MAPSPKIISYYDIKATRAEPVVGQSPKKKGVRAEQVGEDQMGDEPECVHILLIEHETCRENLLSATSAASRGALELAAEQSWLLLEYLENGLETHISKEEGPLFPRLKAALPTDDRLIDEMVAEHDPIRMKRDDLRAVLDHLMPAHDDLRESRSALRAALEQGPSLRALKEATATVAAKLGVHFENEETLVFPLVPTLVDGEQQAQIVREMRDIDSECQSAGHMIR